jgi:hypothetical protein
MPTDQMPGLFAAVALATLPRQTENDLSFAICGVPFVGGIAQNTPDGATVPGHSVTRWLDVLLAQTPGHLADAQRLRPPSERCLAPPLLPLGTPHKERRYQQLPWKHSGTRWERSCNILPILSKRCAQGRPATAQAMSGSGQLRIMGDLEKEGVSRSLFDEEARGRSGSRVMRREGDASIRAVPLGG